MDKTVVALKAELRKATDETVKRWLHNGIHCVVKAMEQQKLVAKKAAKKIKQEAKAHDEEMKYAIKELDKKRHRIK